MVLFPQGMLLFLIRIVPFLIGMVLFLTKKPPLKNINSSISYRNSTIFTQNGTTSYRNGTIFTRNGTISIIFSHQVVSIFRDAVIDCSGMYNSAGRGCFHLQELSYIYLSTVNCMTASYPCGPASVIN